MSQQVGMERADTAAPGSNSGFREWRICLPEPDTSSAAPRRSKRRAKLAAGRILKQPDCECNSAFCSTRQTHLCHSSGWQHLQAQQAKGKVTDIAAVLHSGVSSGGVRAVLGPQLSPCGVTSFHCWLAVWP